MRSNWLCEPQRDPIEDATYLLVEANKFDQRLLEEAQTENGANHLFLELFRRLLIDSSFRHWNERDYLNVAEAIKTIAQQGDEFNTAQDLALLSFIEITQIPGIRSIVDGFKKQRHNSDRASFIQCIHHLSKHLCGDVATPNKSYDAKSRALKAELQSSKNRINELEGQLRNATQIKLDLEGQLRNSSQLKQELNQRNESLMRDVSSLRTRAAASGGSGQKVFVEDVEKLYKELQPYMKTMLSKTSFATSKHMKDLFLQVIEYVQSDLDRRRDTVKDLIFTKGWRDDAARKTQAENVHNFVDGYLQLHIKKISDEILESLMHQAIPQVNEPDEIGNGDFASRLSNGFSERAILYAASDPNDVANSSEVSNGISERFRRDAVISRNSNGDGDFSNYISNRSNEISRRFMTNEILNERSSSLPRANENYSDTFESLTLTNENSDEISRRLMLKDDISTTTSRVPPLQAAYQMDEHKDEKYPAKEGKVETAQCKSALLIAEIFAKLQRVPQSKSLKTWLSDFNGGMYQALKELIASIVSLGCHIAVINAQVELDYEVNSAHGIKVWRRGIEMEPVVVLPGIRLATFQREVLVLQERIEE
ncbi:hypothetical protein HDU97_005131 [Phlyctochytrium planicorne]|nr:hypothetical protein HDU97_005131 [Phlyctochytrium planicorne]